MPKYFVSLILLMLPTILRAAETIPRNYDEAKVPQYTLPDPLTMQDGRKVTTPEQWINERRPELLKLFEEHVYGNATLFRTGNTTFKTRFEYLTSKEVYGGKGIQHQFQIVWYQDEDTHRVDVLAYTPNGASGKVPAFFGLNFMGNHTVDADPDIRIPARIWDRDKPAAYVPGEEKDRAAQAHRWTVELLLDRGYALVTAYYGEIEPDCNGSFRYGIRRFLYNDGEKQAPNEANTIATWAWGLGEMLDAVIHFQDRLGIDPARVAVTGHSRLGKTALWAGAIDERFAMVVSNCSGRGGAALSRRKFGESSTPVADWYSHWYCDNFRIYANGDINFLPVDQHQLIALQAPRPVYVASATEDLWADPKGEFLSALHADPVYRLLGTEGIGGVSELPMPDQSVGGIIRYHNRIGKHDIIEYDWKHYCDFADKYLK